MEGVERIEKAVLMVFHHQQVQVQVQRERRADDDIAEAEALLARLRGDGDGGMCSWRCCCDAFEASRVAEVRFWCLQALVDALLKETTARARLHVLHAHAAGISSITTTCTALSSPERAEIRARALSWLQQDCTTAATGSISPLPRYLVGKLVQLVLCLVTLDFPSQWPDAFHSLLAVLPAAGASSRGVEYVCGVLDSLYDELISQEYPRSKYEVTVATSIKDAMRELAVPNILRALLDVAHSTREMAPEVSRACLESLAKHISWFSVDLALDPAALGVVTSFIDRNQQNQHSRVHLVAGACAYIQAIVSKSMTAQAKLEVLCCRLKIIDILSLAWASSNTSTTSMPMDDEEGDAWAGLVSTACCESLHCLNDIGTKQQQQQQQQLTTATQTEEDRRLLEMSQVLLETLMTRYFMTMLNAQRSSDAISSMLSFVSQYTSFARKQQQQQQQQQPEIFPRQRTLWIAGGIMMSVSNCCLRDEEDVVNGVTQFDEDYDCANETRNEALVNFRNLARILPEECAALVRDKALDLASRNASGGTDVPFAQVENCMALLHELAEGAQEEHAKHKHGCIYEPATLVLSYATSILSAYLANPCISLLFMELCVRYARVIQPVESGTKSEQRDGTSGNGNANASCSASTHAPVIIPGILEHFFGAHGVGSETNSILSARAAYLLLRLVRVIRVHLMPYRHQLIPSLLAPMKRSLRDATQMLKDEASAMGDTSPNMRKEARMHIFEVGGVLVGGGHDVCIFSADEQFELVQSISASLRSAMHEGLELERRSGGDDVEVKCSSVVRATLTAAGHVISGMTDGLGNARKGALCGIFADLFQDALGFFRQHSNVPLLRESICTYLHRSVRTFGEASVNFVLPVIPLLLSTACLRAQAEVMQLVCQLIVELKGASSELVESFMPCVVHNIARIRANTPRPVSSLSASSQASKSSTNVSMLGHSTANVITTEEDREVMEFERSFFQLVQTSLGHVPNVFLSASLYVHLEALLDMLVMCAISHPWPQCRKICISALAQFALAYEKDRKSAPGEGDHRSSYATVPGLDAFLIRRVGGEAGLQFICSDRLDLRDAESINVFADVATCQIILARTFQTEFANYVVEIMGVLSFSADAIHGYLVRQPASLHVIFVHLSRVAKTAYIYIYIYIYIYVCMCVCVCVRVVLYTRLLLSACITVLTNLPPPPPPACANSFVRFFPRTRSRVSISSGRRKLCGRSRRSYATAKDD